MQSEYALAPTTKPVWDSVSATARERMYESRFGSDQTELSAERILDPANGTPRQRQCRAMASDGKIISVTYDYLHTSQPQYLRKLINIKPARSTRSSNHLTLLRPSTTSSLKISNRSYNRTAPILWNNLPKSMRTSSNTSPNAATTSQSTLYHSHFLRLNFAHISKHTFSASRTHLHILSCSDWLQRSLP